MKSLMKQQMTMTMNKNPINSQQENPPSPPTPRRRRLQRLLSSDQQDFQQELRNRIVDNIDAMVNDEDDEVTLYLGSEDEGFQSCQSDSLRKVKKRNTQMKSRLERSG